MIYPFKDPDKSAKLSPTLLAQNMEYLEITMETLVFDILVCWKWLGTNHKQVL